MDHLRPANCRALLLFFCFETECLFIWFNDEEKMSRNWKPRFFLEANPATAAAAYWSRLAQKQSKQRYWLAFLGRPSRCWSTDPYRRFFAGLGWAAYKAHEQTITEKKNMDS